MPVVTRLGGLGLGVIIPRGVFQARVVRTNADLRKVSISLGASSSAAIITLGFGTKKAITLSDELIEWEGLTAERNMMFGYRSEADNVEITFQPLRRDWSLLGLKQKISLFE